MGRQADLLLASNHQLGILLQGLDHQDMEHHQGTFRLALERRRMVTCRQAVCLACHRLATLACHLQATLICHRHLDIRLLELLLATLACHRRATLACHLATPACHRRATLATLACRRRIVTETGGGRGIDDLHLEIGIDDLHLEANPERKGP